MILQNFADCLSDNHIYKPDQLPDVMKIVRKNFRFNVVNTQHKYFNVPAAFDIETSSFYDDSGNKTGLMYAWVFGIYGLTIIGRTWEEFEDLMTELSRILNLNEKKRLIVYVHNLQFDFQFMRTHFDFDKVFACDRRKPLYALTDSGIEFRCSYMLAGLSLAKVGENLLKYHVKKMVGDLNYKLIRHPETPLTKKELGYIQNDAKVVMAYIAEEIERSNGIAKLPLTKTGYVRNYTRHCVFYDPETGRKDRNKQLKYHDIISRLTLDEELFSLQEDAFAGGFTHANVIYVDQIVKNVASYDFTSSYPASLIAERYPMGCPEKIDVKTLTEDEFYHYVELYNCIFTITFKNIRECDNVYDNPISRSKCHICEKARINNGRVVEAAKLSTTITEVDFEIYTYFYDWDEFVISDMYVFERGYLPRDFVISILDLYKNKTELKGVEGKEQEYLVSKGMLNSIYGACVTSPLREINEYTDHWLEPRDPDAAETLAKYNKKFSRVNYYAWGIYCTAYSRRNLFSGIYEAGEDYVYSDTDSIKLVNAAAHSDYFDQYNFEIVEKLKYALKTQDIDPEYIEPKTIKGIKKPLGVWDYEGEYSRFKTLGAKRYMTEKDGKLSMTVSGINKTYAIPYLLKKYKNNDGVFKAFKNGLFVPGAYSGKNTHIYIDDIRAGEIEDYQGNLYNYKELSGIHLEEADYKLKINGDFESYIAYVLKGL